VRGAVVRRQSVDSSSIESVGYDAKYVNGGVYKYFGVPEFVHRRLLTSDSPGAFVNSVIKRNYEFREVR
jgi:KTSC domain